MKEFQKNQIARIILKVRYGIATEEEKQLFEFWIQEKKGHREVYEKIVSNESLKEYLNLKSDYRRKTNYSQIHTDILQRLQTRNSRRKRKQYILWSGSAAAVLLAALLLVFPFAEDPTKEEERIASAPISPPAIHRDKVILVLSDGKEMAVSDLQKDSLKLNSALVIGEGNQLKYQSRIEEENDSSVPSEAEINTIITPTGTFYSLILSDGTQVWLNAESRLEYPVCFGKESRTVKLSGEAYFEVTPDASRPFIVETCEVRTRVLGTSFNIKAYPNEAAISTTLFTGKVEVSTVQHSADGVILSPGRQADWDKKTGVLSVKEALLDHVVAWKNGKFMFNEEDIKVVTRQIERWYGVKFVYETHGRKRYTFNGYFNKDEPVESILNALTFMGGPKFIKDKNTIYVRDK